MVVGEGQATLELALDARATLGEGPVWDAARGCLWWVDITAGLVHRFEPRTGDDLPIAIGSAVGALALRRDGTLLLAVAEGLATLDPGGATGAGGAASAGTTGDALLLRLGAAGDRRRCNDGKCDPAGRLWVGRMAIDHTPGAGTLLRVEADLGVTTRLAGLAIPNGLGWSPDGRRMYFVDSTWGEVRVYPYDPRTGAMGEGSSLVRFAEDGSVPDGLTVDAEGHLWVALWGGSRVVRVAPDGGIVDRVELPVSRPTSCTFGGADLGDLYITTAKGDRPAATDDAPAEPLAGGLFRCRPGTPGQPPVAFAG
jgi:sugar lactone lactonase YvrE